MTLVGLVERVSERTGFTKAQVKNVLKDALFVIQAYVQAGDEVKLQGFGKFSRKRVKPRKMPNGEMSPPKTRMKFKQYVKEKPHGKVRG
jgi:nucleoid DNA-binding protein